MEERPKRFNSHRLWLWVTNRTSYFLDIIGHLLIWTHMSLTETTCTLPAHHVMCLASLDEILVMDSCCKRKRYFPLSYKHCLVNHVWMDDCIYKSIWATQVNLIGFKIYQGEKVRTTRLWFPIAVKRRHRHSNLHNKNI